MPSKWIAAAQLVVGVGSILILLNGAAGIACIGVILVYLIGALEY